MRLKRLAALILTAAILAGLLTAPASAAGGSAFTDISDPATAEAAEVLRALGVVDGTGGTAFNPGRTLSRAEFCKMVVEITGLGGEEPAQRSRTIFPDVASGHWARGYINVAASHRIGTPAEGEPPTMLIMGTGDGCFHPARSITFGEAVTILLRVLDYSNRDLSGGVPWYAGSVTTARSIGLSDGLNLEGNAVITRGQAAILFYHLLLTRGKDSSGIYLTGPALGGREEDGGVLLNVDAVAEDGTAGAVQTTTGTYKTDRAPLPLALEGAQGKVLLDRDGKLLAFHADEKLTRRPVTAAGGVGANYIRLSSGEKLDVKPDTAVYRAGESGTWEAVWQDVGPGTHLSLCYTADGRLSYVFFPRVSGEQDTMVLRSRPTGSANPFGSLTAGQIGCQMYKNGLPAQIGDIRQYDVATYDRASRTLNISDLRLTGVYENVSPNRETPMEVTVMGHRFPVLAIAAGDLQEFELGDPITLLFTSDGRVAGVTAPTTARSTTVAVVKAIDGSGAAVVEPLNTVLPELSGQSGLRGERAERLLGSLVTVSSGKIGQLTLSGLRSSGVSGTLDLTTNQLGSAPLAGNVRFYDQVGTGAPQEVRREQITCGRVDPSQILFAGRDYAGRVNLLVFKNVTGDLYTYGKLTSEDKEVKADYGATISVQVTTLSADGLTAPDGWQNSSMMLVGGGTEIARSFGGVAPSLKSASGGTVLAGYARLTEKKGIRRSDFDPVRMTVRIDGQELPVSEHVSCYNRAVDRWFGETTGAATPKEALAQARAFSDELTVYYDKTPETGGKIRIVVAE